MSAAEKLKEVPADLKVTQPRQWKDLWDVEMEKVYYTSPVDGRRDFKWKRTRTYNWEEHAVRVEIGHEPGARLTCDYGGKIDQRNLDNETVRGWH